MKLDPQAVLSKLKAAIPRRHHDELVVVGSLAAACHFPKQLSGNPINTKDADIVVRPAGSIGACRELAEELLTLGWVHRREPAFAPQPSRSSPAAKPYVKLKMPGEGEFFIEFLGTPKKDERRAKHEAEIKLRDG